MTVVEQVAQAIEAALLGHEDPIPEEFCDAARAAIAAIEAAGYRIVKDVDTDMSQRPWLG